ncbi:hypothetical protein ACFT30_16905 [Microbacterium ureisolvens]|uniref:hypothetical protein n=1 Tax=Microbacterium ureisolvens TaxID=2781186 RepID=UPI0036278A13
MTTDDTALGRPYREIRGVRARDDGPWPGILVRTSGGATRVLVDTATVGPDWAGWDAAPDGHLLAPLDIARHSGGHHIVLPVCTERVEDFVRRRAGRTPLALGEAVTLAVSVLRGCGQLAGAPETQGEWWLDDCGRPVLATDASSRRARDEAAAILERVEVDVRAQRTWSTALRALTADRLSVHELAAAEEALFAVAAPEPLSTVILSPRSASESAMRTEAAVREGSRLSGEPTPASSMWRTLIAGVDDDLADTVSRATTAVWRRVRRREVPTGAPRNRRAPWLVGGAVAAAVLTGGALWPAAGGVATEDSSGSPDGSWTGTPAPSGTPTASETPPAEAEAQAPADSGEQEPGAPTAPADLAHVTAALLDARLACGADATCLSGVAVDAAALSPGGVDLPASQRTVTLLDDFGDLAVLRLDPHDAASPAQMIVILRQDGKWLLRDVYDVAQQP